MSENPIERNVAAGISCTPVLETSNLIHFPSARTELPAKKSAGKALQGRVMKKAHAKVSNSIKGYMFFFTRYPVSESINSILPSMVKGVRLCNVIQRYDIVFYRVAASLRYSSQSLRDPTNTLRSTSPGIPFTFP